MTMMLILPVVGAFAVVGGMLAFLAWCGGQFDAEAGRGGKGGAK